MINDSDVKGQIAEYNWYNRVLNIFNCQYTTQSDNEDAGEIVDNEMHQENPVESCNIPINSHGGKNENNIEVREQYNIELESNKTKNSENSDQVIEITKRIQRKGRKNYEEPSQPVDVKNDIVVIDLET